MATELSAESQTYLAQLDDARGGLPGGGLPWLDELRDAGREGFAARGFPTQKVEEWKYTNLNTLRSTSFSHAADALDAVSVDILPTLLAREHPSHRIVFVNGRYSAHLSDVGAVAKGVTMSSLRAQIERDADSLKGHLGRLSDTARHPFLALNTAFLEDGAVIRVAPDVVLDKPIELIFIGSAGAAPVVFYPRNLIVAGAGSRATVIEHHVSVGSSAYLVDSVTEIIGEPGSILRHCKVQDEGYEAFHVSSTMAALDRDATLDSFVFSVGGRLTRNDLRVGLNAPGADCRLNGAFMGKGTQHIDNTTLIDHAHPHTSSREVYKGVLDDKARAVFQGKILVRQDAQKADGHQLSRTLLLSDRAEIDTKPELEIYADDVKCSHGATAGQLDDDAMFYLRSRGIPESEARSILVAAFLGEVIDGIALAGLRDPLEIKVAQWLGA